MAIIRFVVVCVATFYAICRCSTAYQKNWDLNGKDHQLKTALLEAHNTARANEATAKPPLSNLTWNETLSADAQQWAETCVYGHSKGGWLYGENIAQTGNSTIKTPMSNVFAIREMKTSFNGWLSEKDNFTYPAYCSRGFPNCGHYTQIVWANTKSVGCGIAQCPMCDSTGCLNGLYTVCRYYPPGNIDPYVPYSINGTETTTKKSKTKHKTTAKPKHKKKKSKSKTKATKAPKSKSKNTKNKTKTTKSQSE